jgi:hypothetical protein
MRRSCFDGFWAEIFVFIILPGETVNGVWRQEPEKAAAQEKFDSFNGSRQLAAVREGVGRQQGDQIGRIFAQ